MTTSIRHFLLVNLLLSVVLITTFGMITSLFLEHKDVNIHLDDKLMQSAFAIQAFLRNTSTPKQLQTIQSNINAIPYLQSPFVPVRATHIYPKSFYFRVWDGHGKLLLASATPFPQVFLQAPIGFSQATVEDQTWRAFTVVDPINKLKITVVERYGFQNLLVGHITQEAIFIMLISYPFLGLLIWIIIGRGLSSLQKVSDEVQQRAPDHLAPIDPANVPVEIKPIVEEWNKLFHRLKQAFDREKRFAADAAHELKTPLAALKTHTQLALSAKDENERIAALRKILAGVNRSAHVVQQLLTLSRMNQGLSLEKPQPVNLVRQAKEIIAELVPQALEKNTEIELIAPDIEPIIPGYCTAISILVRNLVDNAIRYTPEHSAIQVIIEPADGDITRMKVIDNGPGIPEHLHQQVFERFFRVIGNKSPGSGLGLGIVQQIVELHHATISLETPPNGKGLQVIVLFPTTLPPLTKEVESEPRP